MAKYKIVEDTTQYKPCFHVKVKKSWWTPWRFVKRHTDVLIAEWDTRRRAQAYINLQSGRK